MCTTHFETIPLPMAVRAVLADVRERGALVDVDQLENLRREDPTDRVASNLHRALAGGNVLHQTAMRMSGAHHTLQPITAPGSMNINEALRHTTREVFVARAGYQLLTVSLRTPELAALAHLSADVLLADGLDSGDLYEHLATNVFAGTRSSNETRTLLWRWMTGHLSTAGEELAAGRALATHLVGVSEYLGSSRNLRHLHRMAGDATVSVYAHAAGVSTRAGVHPVLMSMDTFALEVPDNLNVEDLADRVRDAWTPISRPGLVETHVGTRLG